MAEEKKVFEVYQHSSYGCSVNILAVDETEALEKFEDLVNSGIMEERDTFTDADKPECVEEKTVSDLGENETVFIDGKEYTKESYAKKGKSIEEEKVGLLKSFSNDLDYAFGKIEGLENVREMFYPGGPIEEMLEKLTPEEFVQVFQEKKEKFSEYHKNRQRESRELACGSLANVFEKTIGFYPEGVQSAVEKNFKGLGDIEFEFWTDTAGQDVVVCVNDPADIDDFINQLQKEAESYDVNENVEMYLESGVEGCPDAATLVEDCQEVADTLNELAENISNWRNCSQEYKDIKKKESKDYANPEHDPVESSKGFVGKTDPGVSGPKR